MRAATEAPDPLEKSALQGQGGVLSYRVITLVGLGVLLFGGALWTIRRAPTPAVAATGPTALLDALKEELFQLEMEHKQGQISDKDYTSAKAALDQTLARAIRRKSCIPPQISRIESKVRPRIYTDQKQ